MWTNYHSHCTFCDGRGHMEAFIKYAIAKGIAKYGFSSHAPIPFETHWTMKADDYNDYVAEFQRLKSKYSDKIELFLGLEIDYIVGCTNAKMPFFNDKILDYKIGSIHYLDQLSDGSYCSIDGNFKEFYKGMNELYDGDIRKVTQRYFEVSKLMVQAGGFDIVGHYDAEDGRVSGLRGFAERRGYQRDSDYLRDRENGSEGLDARDFQHGGQ